MNHESTRPRERRGRRITTWRLPLGRVRDLFALLASKGHVYAAVRDQGGPRVRRVAHLMALSRVALRPFWGPDEPVLPPADGVFGRQKARPTLGLGPEGVVLFGLPPCAVHDLHYMDTLLASGPFRDAAYARRRRNALVVAMNCTAPGPRARCALCRTGRRVKPGAAADLVLIPAGSAYMVEAHTPAGRSIVARTRLAQVRGTSGKR